MAANLLTKGKIMQVFYAPNMKSISLKLKLLGRAMSSQVLQNKTGDVSLTVGSPPNWPNTDPDFPMPGNVGVDTKNLDRSKSSTPQKYESLASALFQLENETFRKYQVLSQFVAARLEDEDVEVEQSYDTNKLVECKVQTCPQTLKKDFQNLFSHSFESNDDFTIITISQATENDMSTWSENVEIEREQLTEAFIKNAKEICEKVQNGGYWADFIDPSSGNAYFSEHRNETLFETDDRFNQLGFEIEDLGCCKVLLHKQWKSNVFVGVLFTNAPVESHVFDDM